MKTIFLPAMFCAMVVKTVAQANQTLSNLTSPTSVNQNLLPGTDNKKDLGSAGKSWRRIYFDSAIFLKGNIAFHAPGAANFFAGGNAGNLLVGGVGSTGVGQSALTQLTSGNYNTAFGYQALFSNTTGNFNTATGTWALLKNTTGIYNTAYGVDALYSNTTGSRNTSIGLDALSNSTTGSDNTATGFNALHSNEEAYSNTAYGSASMYSNAHGDNNTASGIQSLYSNIGGSFNTANGGQSLYFNINGYLNTACGYQSLSSNTTGQNNTALGGKADVLSGNLTNATAIGFDAIVEGSNHVHIGNTSVTQIGGYVGWTNFSDGRYKNNIKENVPGLAFINNLRPVTYTINVNGLNERYNNMRKHASENLDEKIKTQMKKSEDAASKIVYNGFIAQEVEAVAKKLNYQFSGVNKPQNEDGIYGLRYSDFVVPLVKAVQELSKKNDELEKQNQELKARLDKIEKMLGQPITINGNKFQ